MQLEDTAWWMVGDGAATATLEQTLGDTRTRRRMPLVQVNRNDTLPGNNIRERINAAYLLASEMKGAGEAYSAPSLRLASYQERTSGGNAGHVVRVGD